MAQPEWGRGNPHGEGREAGPHLGMVEGEGCCQQRREVGEEKQSDVCSVTRALQNGLAGQQRRGAHHVSAWVESDLLTTDETCLDMNLISPGDSGGQRSLAFRPLSLSPTSLQHRIFSLTVPPASLL